LLAGVRGLVEDETFPQVQIWKLSPLF